MNAGCGAAGGHYNPFGVHHGGPADETRYVGVHAYCFLTPCSDFARYIDVWCVQCHSMVCVVCFAVNLHITR